MVRCKAGGVTMRLGEILVLRGVVTAQQLAAALDRQQEAGGRLGEHLVALEAASQAAIDLAVAEAPRMPRTVAETGVSRAALLGLLLKFMRVESVELLSVLSGAMKLPHSVVQELLDEAVARHLVHVLGSVNIGIVRHIRYALSERGLAEAGNALEQSRYLGPAPVSLAAYQAQVKMQALALENLKFDGTQGDFGGLLMSDSYMRKLLPAVNAGQTILLYGPPGNGKTSVGLQVARLFRKPVCVPYALEISGQIIKVHDQTLHVPFVEGAEAALAALNARAGGALQIEQFDPRWAICKRPVAVAGGELSLDMLELRFDPEAKTYDAPLHMKALNGVFLIDDFGRQRVSPADLLNRWIIPLESRVDYLKLNTGKSFSIPFDELVIFSTNLAPADLMDPAFLRRIPYKIHMTGPGREDFRRVFETVAAKRGLSLRDDAFEFVVQRLTGPLGAGLAYFQPGFICEQVHQVCRCFGYQPVITRELAADALANLYVEREGPPVEADVVGLNVAA